MKKLAIAFVLTLMAACSSAPKTNSLQSSQTSGSSNAPATIPSSTVATKNSVADNNSAANNSPAPDRINGLADLNTTAKTLKKDSVYFDFDKFEIRPEYRDTIQQQVEFIKEHKNEIVVLEGNADERGSTEYNLALGEERAKAVEKSLQLLGVPATQIEVISLGETKPRLACHQEQCWHENRRVDFVLKHS
ncbi:MAG: peptidoglycan-associated lipoprotein Pal [Gallionellaceae bacterium]|nr:MAG: peptidoglycan-associated lipoprotein Pal [Gallionellaceae bacterium]